MGSLSSDESEYKFLEPLEPSNATPLSGNHLLSLISLTAQTSYSELNDGLPLPDSHYSLLNYENEMPKELSERHSEVERTPQNEPNLNLSIQVSSSKRTKQRVPEVFKLFLCKKSEQRPKKEYIRQTIIRKHKTFNRNIGNDSTKPFLSKLGIQEENLGKAHALLDKLKKLYEKHGLSEVSQTTSGPKVNGGPSTASTREKSCNDAFCKFYFSQEGIHQSFQSFIELIELSNLDTLCGIFNVRCCTLSHSLSCADKINQLTSYMKSELIESSLSCTTEVKQFTAVNPSDFLSFK